jgi:hypothetical protein
MPSQKTQNSSIPTANGTADRSHFNQQRNGKLDIKPTHHRNQSDEMGQLNNQSNMMSNQKYFNIPGKTVLNTNLQTLVDHNTVNTKNFSTAIGTQ